MLAGSKDKLAALQEEFDSLKMQNRHKSEMITTLKK